MPLKQELLKKVPATLQKEPSFRMLLQYLRQHGIKDAAHLLAFLQQDISLAEKSLERCRQSGSTGVKTARDIAMKLKLLKKCRVLAERYL